MKYAQLFIFFFSAVLIQNTVAAQQTHSRNLILITLDGLRWQEVFEGADSALLFNDEVVKDKSVRQQLWHSDFRKRREMLLPFFWKVIARDGQLLGNRKYGNQINCANPHWFSYPGYSEMLTGVVDGRVRSNDTLENVNATVLEFIHGHEDYTGKVAAFTTWDVFPYILREKKSGVPVNAGDEKATGDLSDAEILLNELQDLIPNPHGSRFDAFTFFLAFEYLKRANPRVLFIGMDETDEHAHGGRYDDYLKSAHRADYMLQRLWNWIQSHPQYRDQTTLLITTDHGRGKGARHAWRSHGRLTFGSGQIWLAAIGPDTPPLGELKFPYQVYQKQIARTLAAFLGLDYRPDRKAVAEPIDILFYSPELEASLRAAGSAR
ncbi:MAG: phosphoglyceromutase [Cyclobacteriaceae bacterium]|nr:phosphoglyceromutase [Cyclobacteriaceae bacterium]